MKILVLLSTLLLSVFLARAQETRELSAAKEVFTTFVNDWAQAGIMYNVKGIIALDITQLDINTLYAEKDGVKEFYIYTKSGSYIGSERNEGAWTLHEKVSVTGAGLNKRTSVQLSNPIKVAKDATIGIYMSFPDTQRTDSLRMTKATKLNLKSGDLYTSNGELSLYVGTGKRWKFHRNIVNMIPNVAIHYQPDGSNGDGTTHSLPCQTDFTTTTYSGQDGSDGIMFDMKALEKVYVFGFDIHTKLKTKVEVTVYSKAGTMIGSEDKPADWHVASSSTVTGKGQNQATDIGKFSPVIVNKSSTQAWYITLVTTCTTCADLRYSSSSTKKTGDVYKQTFDMQIMVGKGIQYKFKGGAVDKVFNGRLKYYTDWSSVACPPSSPPEASPSFAPSKKHTKHPTKKPTITKAPTKPPQTTAKPTAFGTCKKANNEVGGIIFPLYGFVPVATGTAPNKVCEGIFYKQLKGTDAGSSPKYISFPRTKFVFKYSFGQNVDDWKVCLKAFKDLGAEVLMYVNSKGEAPHDNLYRPISEVKKTVDDIFSNFKENIDGIFYDNGTNMVDTVGHEESAGVSGSNKEEIAKAFYGQLIEYVIRTHNACKVVVNFRKPYYISTMQKYFKDHRIIAIIYEGTFADYTSGCTSDFDKGPFCKYTTTAPMQALRNAMTSQQIYKQQSGVLVHSLSLTGLPGGSTLIGETDRVFNISVRNFVNWVFVTDETDDSFNLNNSATATNNRPNTDIYSHFESEVFLFKPSP